MKRCALRINAAVRPTRRESSQRRILKTRVLLTLSVAPRPRGSANACAASSEVRVALSSAVRISSPLERDPDVADSLLIDFDPQAPEP